MGNVYGYTIIIRVDSFEEWNEFEEIMKLSEE
jgi:hypothetical protein